MARTADGPAISAAALTMRFGSFTAVQDVSFDVSPGEIFGFLGPNGSGKSTVIRMLCGLLRPSEGSGHILGMDSSREAESVKRSIGYMSQKFSLYPDLTVHENLSFYGRIYGLGRRLHERMDAVVKQLHLAPYVQRRAGALSGGWKQRLALACALLHEPRVMFLDEPTAGIDPVARRELWDFLYELAGRGVTLFVTTHYMDEAERCNRLGYIYLSRMLLLGTPDELKADPRVTPDSARWYEAGLDGVEPPLEKLGKQEGISDVTVFGNTLHLLADSRVSQPQLTELAGGLEFREGAPTLEDVFVRLTRLAEQQREAAMMRGLGGIIYKEFIQITRNPATLVITLLIPIIQLIIFGYAIDTEVRNVRTQVLDLDNTPQSREFLNRFRATGLYDIRGYVASASELESAIVSGQASVGIQIPSGYGRELSGKRPAEILVLIDGSNNTIASQTMSTAQTLGIRMSIEQLSGSSPERSLLIDVRPRFLFNPALRSANFFVPGLVGVILFLVTMLLTSFAIVSEKELGTMEQLAVSPVSRGGLMLGKILPYLLLGMIQMNVVLFFAQFIFKVEIAGSLPLPELLALVFVFSSLGLGLIISTIAKTQLQAMLMSFMILLPSILLSGFIFPRESMPLPIYWISALLPVTYFVEILRGVILRSVGMEALWDEALILTCMGLLLLAIATVRFRKTVG